MSSSPDKPENAPDTDPASVVATQPAAAASPEPEPETASAVTAGPDAEVAEPRPAPTPPPPPRPEAGEHEEPESHRRSTALGLFLVFLLLLVFLNLGVVYWLWQAQTENTTRIQRIDAAQGEARGLTETIEQARTGLTTLAGDLDDTTQFLNQKAARLERDLSVATESISVLSTASQQLRAKVEGGATAWRLDAVEQLLMTANERLLLANDARSAEQALALADARLQAIADPAWVELRRQIADEMASLRAMPEIDITAISLKLQALSDRAAGLPLAGHLQRDQRRADRAVPADEQSATPAAAPWHERLWKKTQEAVLSLVTIRQNTTPTAPLLPPDLHGLLVQNLRLQLEAARTALLLRDAAQYDNALRTAADWVQRYLGTEDPSVQAAAETLAELRRMKISPTPPDISGSLRRLRQLRDQG